MNKPRRYRSPSTPSPGCLSELPTLPEGARSSSETLLSLCMIVRDASRTLRSCLEGIAPWVDEMVIVDTGSLDDTVSIAQEFGARVYHTPWTDDFAKARNESLRWARGRWIFWLDADDTIDAENGGRLRHVVSTEQAASIFGFVMQVHCPGPRGDTTVVDQVKLFRNGLGLRFEGRIHEQILPSIRRLGGEVKWTDVRVVHSGADLTAEGRERKRQRDFRILALVLKEEPDNTFALFNLGMTLCDAGRFDEALNALARALQMSKPSESHVRKIFALLVHAYQCLGRLEAARHTCAQGLTQFPDDIELNFRRGVLARSEGRLAEAEAAFRRVLQPKSERHFSSLDPSMSGLKALMNLAAVLEADGRRSEAANIWLSVVAQAPLDLSAWEAWARLTLELEQSQAVQDKALDISADPAMTAVAAMLRGLYAGSKRDIDLAQHELLTATELSGDNPVPLDALCRLCFLVQRFDLAERHLARLALLDSQNGAVHYNRGVSLLRLGRLPEAAAELTTSLDKRPGHAATRRALDQVNAAIVQGKA